VKARSFTLLLVCSLLLRAGEACLGPDAVWKLRAASDPQMRVHGGSIVYIYTWADPASDFRYSNLREVDGNGHERKITDGKQHDTFPRWSQDGARLAYVSDRDGAPRIYVRNWSTGEETRVTDGKLAPSRLAWSPDGKWIAFLAFVSGESTWAPPMPKMPNGANWAPPAAAVTDLRWTFDGIGVREPGGTRILVVPASGGPTRQISGDPFQLTSYLFEPEVTWSADSRWLLSPAVKAGDGWSTYTGGEIYAFPLSGGLPLQVTHLGGYETQVRASPDGKKIGFAGFPWKGRTYHVSRLMLMDADGGQAHVLTAGWDRDVRSLVWSADSHTIYFVSDDQGSSNVYAAELNGRVRQVTRGSHHYGGLSLSDTGEAASVYEKSNQPGAIVRFRPESDAEPTIVADPNAEYLSGCRLPEAQEIWYESFDGTKVQGWVLHPTGFQPSQKYPLILSMHGGPHGAYGFSFNAELQMLAGHGYVVLYTNPRGSTGYGESFGNVIQHRWPGDDIKDVLSGVDLLVRSGSIDSARMAVTGGSGGGLMTCWMVTQTDRFRAAVAFYPVTNWFTHVGSADNGYYIASVYRKGMPWDDPADYIAHSPLFFAKKVTTPTMIITGEDDWRTPIAQSQEFFRALKVRGVDTVLVRVPGEGHGLTKRPSHQQESLVHMLAWLDRYIPIEKSAR
jgi:dipeptidyl aminopeptidase/acylaminoacyl peptidase